LLGARFLDDSGFQITGEYTPFIKEDATLEEVRSAVRGWPEMGRSTVLGQLARLDGSPRDRADRDLRRAVLQAKIAMTFMYEGRFGEVGPWLERAVAENPNLPPDLKANLLALRGVAALRGATWRTAWRAPDPRAAASRSLMKGQVPQAPERSTATTC
jgi:hypothetical protein